MTNQTEKEFSALVRRSFLKKEAAGIEPIKDFCLQHFSTQLVALQQKMTRTKTAYYEKEMLLVNDDIEITASGWLPGNTCYPHDHNMAECFVFVLQGQVENTLFRFDDSVLTVRSKAARSAGGHFYIADGSIHAMRNTGTDNLICLHVYTPGISEMKVFDEQHQMIYTLHGDAGAWLPAKEEHVFEVRLYTESAVEAIY